MNVHSITHMKRKLNELMKASNNKLFY